MGDTNDPMLSQGTAHRGNDPAIWPKTNCAIVCHVDWPVTILTSKWVYHGVYPAYLFQAFDDSRLPTIIVRDLLLPIRHLFKFNLVAVFDLLDQFGIRDNQREFQIPLSRYQSFSQNGFLKIEKFYLWKIPEHHHGVIPYNISILEID